MFFFLYTNTKKPILGNSPNFVDWRCEFCLIMVSWLERNLFEQTPVTFGFRSCQQKQSWLAQGNYSSVLYIYILYWCMIWSLTIPYHPCTYGIFTYIWFICMVNVGKYTIHGWYGYCISMVLVVALLLYMRWLQVEYWVFANSSQNIDRIWSYYQEQVWNIGLEYPLATGMTPDDC